MDTSDTPHPYLERYFESCHRRQYAAGSTIISAGDLSNALFYLVSGSVSVVIEDDDGHEFVLAYLNAGDFFGEIGLFDEKRERSAWVRARTPTEVAQLSYDRFRELTRTAPELIYFMLSRLSMRVRDTTRKVGDLAFKDVAGRVAGALLDLCEQPDAEPIGDAVRIRITRQELGRIVGCSREMASRVLRDLEEKSIIEVSGKSVLVMDPPRGRH